MHQIPEDTFKPEMMADVGSKSVVILTDDKVEDLEFYYPYYRFIEEGFKVGVITPKGGDFKGKTGYEFKGALKIKDAFALSYDLLFIPGGKAPGRLCENTDALTFTRDFVNSGKPVAAICHGPQLLAAAHVISGLRMAGWPEIEKDIKQGGGIFVNAETVVDGQFITARWPGDLPAFIKRTLEIMGESRIHAAGNGSFLQREAS